MIDVVLGSLILLWAAYLTVSWPKEVFWYEQVPIIGPYLLGSGAFFMLARRNREAGCLLEAIDILTDVMSGRLSTEDARRRLTGVTERLGD